MSPARLSPHRDRPSRDGVPGVWRWAGGPPTMWPHQLKDRWAYTRLRGFQHKQTAVPYANMVISLTHHTNIWDISCVLLHKQDLIQSSQLSTWVSPLFVSFSVGRWNNLLGRTHLANDWSQIQKTRCGNEPEKLTCPTPTNHWTQTRSTDAPITGITQHANWRGL